ncbi:MAG TPA: hypothetical protein VLT33_42575 [Labilithrix sp.]|nr:hypothetical protein [Labilithrix sp.]
MMVRRFVLVAAAAALALGGMRAIVACSEITPTTYGNPNTLDRKSVPGEGGVEQLVCSGVDGGETFDGGCPSFATDIYPYFGATGTWRCSDKTCHGGTSAPAIDPASAAACLASLKKITVKGTPYLLSDGGKDPNASSFLCNLQGSCGSPMPKAPGAITSAELCKVEAWLKCGAPN